jgi:hypothetical protein
MHADNNQDKYAVWMSVNGQIFQKSAHKNQRYLAERKSEEIGKRSQNQYIFFPQSKS